MNEGSRLAIKKRKLLSNSRRGELEANPRIARDATSEVVTLSVLRGAGGRDLGGVQLFGQMRLPAWITRGGIMQGKESWS